MTLTEAEAFWRVLLRAVANLHVVRQPPAWRRRRCGEMRVTLTERRAMQAFHVLDGESYSALGRRFRRDRHYMPRWIWDEEYRAFHAYYWSTHDGPTHLTQRSRRTPRADAAPASS